MTRMKWGGEKTHVLISEKKVLRFTEHILWTRHDSGCLIYMVSFHPFNSQVIVNQETDAELQGLGLLAGLMMAALWQLGPEHSRPQNNI